MRKLFLSTCAAMCMMITSCTPDVTQIQQITQQICGFVPTAVVIANFFPNPYTVPAATVAQAICAAVQAQVPLSTRRSARLKGSSAPVTVNVQVAGQNFVVTGYFTK